MGAFNEMSIGTPNEGTVRATRAAVDMLFRALESEPLPTGTAEWRWWETDGIVFRERRSPPVEIHATLRDCITVYRETPLGPRMSYYREIGGCTFACSAQDSLHPTHHILGEAIADYLERREA